MADRIVINAGPLIAFARAEALTILEHLPYEFICPPEVHSEVLAGKTLGHAAVRAPWLKIVALLHPLHPVVTATLDTGEAAVVQLALEQNIHQVCLDDLRARRVALAAGLNVTGSLGLLGRAKRLGIIVSVKPLIDRLTCEGVWYRPELIRTFLKELGE